MATVSDPNSEKSIAVAAAIDFSTLGSIAAATAIDSNNEKSMTVATAIDISTLQMGGAEIKLSKAWKMRYFSRKVGVDRWAVPGSGFPKLRKCDFRSDK